MIQAKRIGIVGIGLMGHGIATNLLKGGYDLCFLEHPGNRPTDELVAAGARGVSTPAELARGVDVVILVVTGSAEVRDVLFRDDGVLAGLQSGAIVVDCSTCEPASTQSVAAAVAEKGGRFLDAPMTRTPREAAEGRLNLIVGGDAGLLAEVEPMLRCFAENIAHAGAVGAGHTMKLLHNFISLGNAALLAEAAQCARAAGVDMGVFVDVLGTGGGDGVVFRRLAPYFLKGDASGFVFTIANALKDLTYYRSMADGLGVPCGAATAVQEMLANADSHGHAARTMAELVDVIGEAGNRR